MLAQLKKGGMNVNKDNIFNADELRGLSPEQIQAKVRIILIF